jgi:hypothetical protein
LTKGAREALLLSYKTLDMSQTKNSKLESKLKNKMLKTSWVLMKNDVLLTSEKIGQQKGPGSVCVQMGIVGRTL